MSSKLIAPKVIPDLDPGFRPSALVWLALKANPTSLKVTLAVEQADGSVFHHTCYLPDSYDPETIAFSQYLLMHYVRAALWIYGGFRVHIHNAPLLVTNWLKHQYYCYDPRGLFDADVMGDQIYFRQFEIVVHNNLELMPIARQTDLAVRLGGKGCFIGFDLGASNRRVAAVVDGKVVYQNDMEWLPTNESNPDFHFNGIMASLRDAAGHLPRVDGIGGSAAGVYVENSPRIASLFRGVPREQFREKIVPLFQRIKGDFGGIPVVVVNDGEVAALAAAIERKAKRVLGLALGSSTAGGFVTGDGNLTSQLDELAFVPFDLNPNAPRDPWSGFHGCGALYLSQQMTPRLAGAAGIKLDPKLGLPDQLKFVQSLFEQDGEEMLKAARVFRNVGIHLGYALAAFDQFYGMEMAYLMGRVLEGRGGELVVEGAKRVFEVEFPELAARCEIVRPTGESVSMGQAIAAAYLAAN